MKTILAIARRELQAYFATPVGWLVLCGFVAITGVFFSLMMISYAIESAQQGMNPYGGEGMNINEMLLPGFFGNTAVILLLLSPALSMGIFAEDRSKRSFELLLASPATSTEIVLGKYLGALCFMAAMLLSTVHLVAILYWLGNPDASILVANYGSLLLVAAAILALGMFVSSFTENQLVALVLSFGAALGLWVMSWPDSLSDQTWVKVISYLSVLTHQNDMAKGLLHLKDIVYYATFIGFFLFATQQRVEAYRWQ